MSFWRSGLSDNPNLALAREVGEIAFGLDAEGYHAARLPYPHELYDELFANMPARAQVLEIASGTGLVTQELLSRNVSSVTAVEPNHALATFTARRLNDRRLSIIEAPFPNVSIDGRFDLIACAAAFHWMEPVAALAKVKELLDPDGVWAMWWHSYRNPGMGDELADQISLLLKDIPLPPSTDLHRHYSLDEERHRQMLNDAGFRSIEYRLFRSERELTTDGVLALYKSYSFVRLLAPDRRAQLLDELANLVESRFGGRASNLVLTPLYLASL